MAMYTIVDQEDHFETVCGAFQIFVEAITCLIGDECGKLERNQSETELIYCSMPSKLNACGVKSEGTEVIIRPKTLLSPLFPMNYAGSPLQY